MADRFKFRYLFDNKLYEVALIDFRLNKIYLKVDDKFPIRTELDDKRLIQCTGVKDKNGKLIYEGDILKDKYDCLHPISWNIKGFYEADTFALAGFYKPIQEDMKVIGNIYENPELIKDGE